MREKSAYANKIYFISTQLCNAYARGFKINIQQITEKNRKSEVFCGAAMCYLPNSSRGIIVVGGRCFGGICPLKLVVGGATSRI